MKGIYFTIHVKWIVESIGYYHTINEIFIFFNA